MELTGLYAHWRTGFAVIFKYIAAILVAMACCCLTIKAQDTAKVHQLREVQVSQRLNTLPASSPTPSQILKGAALERLNSLSVADAIRYFSGAQLKDYGGVGGLKTVDIRSLGSSQTAVFYDGIQLGNAQNGQVDLSKLSMDNIGGIELYNAQKSTIFQPARGLASGSSIYLNTREPTFLPGKSNLLKASFRGGSMGLINPSALWQHQISNSVYSSVSTEYTRSNGRYKFRYTNGVYDTTAIRNNGDIDALRVEAGLNGRLADSSSWSVKAYLYNSERGLPGAIIENRFDYNQREWDRNIFVQSRYEMRGKVYSLMLNAKYANDYMRYLNPDIVTTEGFSNSRYHQHEVYISAANRLKINSFWSVVLSADYQRNTMQSNIFRFSYPTRNLLLSALATQLKWSRLNVQANILGTFVKESTELYQSANNRTKYTPAVMGSWQPFASPDFHVRGFYKSIYRLPTFNELYYTFVGQANLRPEYSRQLDAGITYQRFLTGKLLRHISIQTDAYYNRVNDKIIAVPSLNLQRWRMENVSRVNIKGLETNIQSGWYFNQKVLLNAGVSYTYQQAIDATDGSLKNQQIPYVPVHSGSVLAGIQWQKFAFNYSFIYTGDRYNQKANIPENYVQPWYTHDVSASWNTPWQQHQLKLGIDINNLFNQYYDVITNFPMPGHYYRFKLSFTI
ncbi:TonB-dependent receptor plug domain-containing protein [Mucilaginibacter terrae]|uniref:Vitamin B12 transporter n=1 Tax=Mucilaginibacter terrae TaxID=1955052 RepID=A0ABU3GPY8_9SPHI|nr:TonB-dependent receptor [Mucilaginibacter terrae]MDT3401849.1 vitamin B12 transporter [Mucilaginibacter terrae]